MIREQVVIAGHHIRTGGEPFLVAEVGINHNGDVDIACRMIEAAKNAGVDAIKFQTFTAREFITDETLTFTYRSRGEDVTESMLAMFERHELSRDAWRSIKKRCDELSLPFLSTPQNPSDLALLLELGVPAVKVGSDDLINIPLLKHYASTQLPLILSTGMAEMDEVDEALRAVGTSSGYPTVVLVCTSEYPAPPEALNLRRITTLTQTYPGLPVGLSDHSQGPIASSLALALGACILEKHFTLGHDLEGPDHWFSEDPRGLQEWVTSVRATATMLGSPVVAPTAAEREVRHLGRRSVVALGDIAEGETFTDANVGLRRPGGGLAPARIESILGGRAARALRKGELLSEGDWR